MPRKRALFFLAIVACLATSVAAQRREAFEDELFVREVELVFELDLTFLRSLTFGPESLVVVEDGQYRSVTKVDSLEETWNAVVWVDKALAEPETVFLGALALAQQASELARMASVEVVVASPGVRIETASTREPRRLEQVLADLAGKARVERDRAAARPGERSGVSSRPDATTLRRQLDRLLVHLAGRRDPGPRVLFLIADGFVVTPRESKAFETGSAAPEAGERAAAIQGAARLLAAYGWVTVVLPLRKEVVGEEHHGHSEVNVFRGNHGTWGGNTGNSVPPIIPPKAPKDSTLRWDSVLRALTEPNLSPLRALMEPTAGMLVPNGEVLPATLEKLGGRWHLYYQTQMPVDGKVRSVEVRWRDGTPLRARRWLRSSTPEGIAEARLRRLLEGERLPESLPLRAEPSGGGLKLTVAPFSAPEPVILGPVRISLAYAGPDGTIRIRHETAPGIEAPDKGWSHTLPSVLSSEVPPLAVLVEDLARERWRAVLYLK
ncbi:MAG TPA: hypothetical protein VN493_13645 [Thermoanaerobaculia bacterium]|nr:hypothetical protein [Thermoanaerobaculia bacterium]